MLGDLIFDPSDAGVVAGVLLVALAGLPTLWRLRSNPLDAPALYVLTSIILLGVTALAWTGEPIRPGPGLMQADVADALRLVAVGLLVFGLGARLLPAAPVESAEIAPGDAPSPAALGALFSVTAVGLIASIALGLHGYVSDREAVARAAEVKQLLALLPDLGVLVIGATALVYFSTGDRRYRWLLIGFTVLQMSIAFAGGNKGLTIDPLLLIMLAYILVRRTVPVRGILLTALLLFLVIVPINQRYRAELKGPTPQTPAVALQGALSKPPVLYPVAALMDAKDYAFTRLRSIDSVALIRDRTPSPFPYAGGDKYFQLPAIILVPRAIWPDKPKLDDAGRFTNTYGQRPSSIASATQITTVGDLYRNFGYAGVVVGMFLWGLAVSALALASRRWRSPRADLVLILVVLTLAGPIAVDTTLTNLIATTSKALPFALLVAWLLLPGPDSGPGYRRLIRGAH